MDYFLLQVVSAYALIFHRENRMSYSNPIFLLILVLGSDSGDSDSPQSLRWGLRRDGLQALESRFQLRLAQRGDGGDGAAVGGGNPVPWGGECGREDGGIQ